jgi:hypothetical protein
VHKCCGQEAVPGQLRTKVLSRIAVVRAELEVTEITEVTEVTEVTTVTRLPADS